MPRPHWILLLTLLLSGCPEVSDHADAGTAQRKLEVIRKGGPDVGLRPGVASQLQVRYTRAAGGAIPGAQVRFAIFGDPHGSTLSTDRAETNASGEAVITVRAGAGSSRFEVRASADGAGDAIFYVEVSDKGFGSLSITGKYGGSLPLLQLDSVTYYLLSGGACSGFDALSPAKILRTRKANGLAPTVLFTAISLGSARAVASRASSADGTPLAAGCVEVPGSVLRADQVLSLSLDLRDLLPRIKGSYQLTTEVRLPTGKVGSLSWPRPLADALTPWGDLSDCKWDPAQALLDCLVDALDVSDPLDCLVDKPSAKALSIQNERGVVSSGCRTGLTQRGTTSLEKQLHSRMELQDKSLLVSLAKVEADALTMLGDLKLLSTLELSTLDSDGAAVARHELKAVALGKSASQVSFKADEIGLTSLAAHPIKATVKSWQLSLAQHALSLSFGILARAALSDGILGPAKLPKKSAKLAGKLANLVQVSVSGKTLSGCSAIEELVCKAARLGAGCLGKACAEGLTAMAARLDHGFTQIDQHKAADLVLSGEVALTDNNKDLRADILGSSTAPGLWKMKLQLSNEQVSPAEAEFTGKR